MKILLLHWRFAEEYGRNRLGIHREQIEPHSPENKRPEPTVAMEGKFYE